MSQYGNTLVGIQRNNRGKFQSSTRDTRGTASGLIALMTVDLFIHSDILSALVYIVSQGQPFSWLLKWQQIRASHCGWSSLLKKKYNENGFFDIWHYRLSDSFEKTTFKNKIEKTKRRKNQYKETAWQKRCMCLFHGENVRDWTKLIGQMLYYHAISTQNIYYCV